MNQTPSRNTLLPMWSGRLGSWRLRVEREPEPQQAVVQRYDEASSGWSDRLELLGFDRAYAALAARIGVSQGRMLDAGMGDGSLASAFTTEAPGLALHGVDLSPAMLARSATRLAHLPCAPRLQQADLCALPYADASFDLVACAHVFEHLPEPELAMNELARVTRRGGRIVLVVTRHGPIGAWIALTWRVRCFGRRDLLALASSASLVVQDLRPLDGPWRCRYASYACVLTHAAG